MGVWRDRAGSSPSLSDGMKFCAKCQGPRRHCAPCDSLHENHLPVGEMVINRQTDVQTECSQVRKCAYKDINKGLRGRSTEGDHYSGLRCPSE